MLQEETFEEKDFANYLPYSKGKRIQELLSISIVLVLLAGHCVFIICNFKAEFTIFILPCVFAGLLIADFESGFVHWFMDTYGSENTPILGETILAFRQHHRYPIAITYNTTIRTFGDPAASCLPQLLWSTWTIKHFIGDTFSYFLVLFVFAWCGLQSWVNQIHQWSHTHSKQIPPVAQLLQKVGLILSKQHHHKHHISPHTCDYCVVSGIMDGPLEALQFWRRMENLIEYLTSVKPRSECKSH
ncbi:plasmanylethanolamine desaturase 1-like isoform X1 [Clavelina lepadiformis]|uniref:plasmanylethanolamine desaturase 1-like isoform X1 n=1 Tax=Clavelina lepadiformis TaxID=159417 RepID=UPI004042F70A